MTLIDTGDSRFAKAVQIAGESGQWLKCRTRDGRKVYGVPSQRVTGQFHLADAHQCTCADFQRRQQACKHVLAVCLYVALVRAQQRARP